MRLIAKHKSLAGELAGRTRKLVERASGLSIDLKRSSPLSQLPLTYRLNRVVIQVRRILSGMKSQGVRVNPSGLASLEEEYREAVRHVRRMGRLNPENSSLEGLARALSSLGSTIRKVDEYLVDEMARSPGHWQERYRDIQTVRAVLRELDQQLSGTVLLTDVETWINRISQVQPSLSQDQLRLVASVILADRDPEQLIGLLSRSFHDARIAQSGSVRNDKDPVFSATTARF